MPEVAIKMRIVLKQIIHALVVEVTNLFTMSSNIMHLIITWNNCVWSHHPRRESTYEALLIDLMTLSIFCFKANQFKWNAELGVCRSWMLQEYIGPHGEWDKNPSTGDHNLVLIHVLNISTDMLFAMDVQKI